MATVDGSYFLVLAKTASAMGMDGAALLADVGLEMSQSLLEQRLPTETLSKLCDRLVEQSGDPWIGFSLGQKAPLDQGALRVVTYACGGSPNVREGFARLGRYLSLVNKTSVVFVAETPDDAYLIGLRPSPGQAPHPVSVHFFLAAVYRMGSTLVKAPLDLKGVWLTAEQAPGFPSVFGDVPIRFSAVEDALWMNREALYSKFIPDDAELSGRLEQTAQKMLAALPKDDFGTQAKAAIIQLLADDPGLDAVAARLELSPRTLQRRLKAEGLVHQDLVETVRKELSASYLLEPTLSFTDIAFLLGYSDATAFSRAYKRWTGQSPSSARGAALAKTD